MSHERTGIMNPSVEECINPVLFNFFLVFKWPITTLSVFEKGYLLKSSSETYLILQLPLCSSKVDLLKKRNYSTKLSKLIFYSLKERSAS